MEVEYKFKNNAGEEFMFFSDEENKPCLSIRFGKELLASFMLSKEESELVIKALTKINKL